MWGLLSGTYGASLSCLTKDGDGADGPSRDARRHGREENKFGLYIWATGGELDNSPLIDGGIRRAVPDGQWRQGDSAILTIARQIGLMDH